MNQLIKISDVKHSLISQQFITAQQKLMLLEPSIQTQLLADFDDLHRQIADLPAFKKIYMKLLQLMELEVSNARSNNQNSH